jgi:tetratricopeptide (TPR) repeat protein
MRSVLGICLLIFVTAFSTEGFADNKDEKKAAAAFKKGIDFYKSGNMEAAVKAFRRADALKPSWKIQYNIGQCEAALKRYGLAIEAFEHYLGKGGDEVPTERRDQVLKELDRLRRMVGTISIKGEPGVDVYVDIVKRANTSNRSSIKVTAGVEHEITFVKDGDKIGTVRLVVSGGEVVVLPVDSKKPATTVSVDPPPPLPPEPEATPPPPAAAAPPPPVVTPAPPPQPVTNVVYTNMRQLKEALSQNRITRAEYAKHQAEIRKMRNAEFEKLKMDLRARKINKYDYKRKIVEIRRKYEGQ